MGSGEKDLPARHSIACSNGTGEYGESLTLREWSSSPKLGQDGVETCWIFVTD